MLLPVTEPYVIQGYGKQLDFMNYRERPYVGFVGGRGSGKSNALAMRLLKSSMQEPGLYGAYSATYPLLRDTILRVFTELAKPFIVGDGPNGEMVVKMTSGSEILFRSLDDPERARGPSLRGAVWDEMSLCKKEAFDILIACLRWNQTQGWLASAFTPKGLLHWSANVFHDESRPDVKCFHATSRENPFNPPGFADMLARQYTTAFAQQEIEGKFITLAGHIFRREWFKTVDDIPPLKSIIRYWDMAATPLNSNNDPDWTSGVKLGRTMNGQWIVLDVRHSRLSPAGNEMLVGSTAAEDGKQVRIGMEEEGGASGKSLVDHYRRNILVGYHFSGNRPTGDKQVRAMPLAAAAEHGNVMVLRNDSWNKDYLDEMESFEEGCSHDDQVDATDGGMFLLSSSGKGAIRPHVGSDDATEAAEVNQYADILAEAKTPQEREELMRMIASMPEREVVTA